MILVEGLHHISLGSSNLQRSVQFYTEVLDFELLEESENHALVRLDPIAIRFNLIPDFTSAVENPGEFSLSFILDVDDFTEAIQELEQREIKIIKGPLLIEGGESLLVADPDGHLLELFYRE
ncbi:MAG: dioxygenase [Spirochaetaceae bacterium]|nr:dioxygenase [Spirochaetaceae bacterium]|tara:strand:+ start:1599 stop:1964 length:366 start_codon:yes stop_codon:yes gene_type:complete